MSSSVFAFFDVDGTLLHLKSMFSFHDFWYGTWLPGIKQSVASEKEDISAILRALERSGVSREIINRRYYEFFAGRDIQQISKAAVAWYEQVRSVGHLYIDAAVDELNRLRKLGIEPVLVSGSFMEVLAPIAEALNIKHILASNLVVNNGICTGKIYLPQTIGAGKSLAMRHFMAQQGARAEDCWAVGDDISDLPMLESVGHQMIVSGNTELEAIAHARSWKIINASVGKKTERVLEEAL